MILLSALSFVSGNMEILKEMFRSSVVCVLRRRQDAVIAFGMLQLDPSIANVDAVSQFVK